MNQALSNESITNLTHYIFDKYDLNKNNYLGIEEIRLMLQEISSSNCQLISVGTEEAKDFLKIYDNDKDGYIGFNDLKEALYAFIGTYGKTNIESINLF